jgi:SOS response regulatory protein OraA/RecX
MQKGDNKGRIEMTEIRLAMLNDEIVFESFLEDARNLKKVQLSKLNKFMDWAFKTFVNRALYVPEDLAENAKEFNFSLVTELASALRLLSFLFNHASEITAAELESDLEKLGFEKEKLDVIINSLSANRSKYKEHLKTNRSEVTAGLSSIHWRVDNRVASSDFLDNHEIVAVLKLSAILSGKTERFTFELDHNRILWFEKEFAKMKKAFLEAEKNFP